MATVEVLENDSSLLSKQTPSNNKGSYSMIQWQENLIKSLEHPEIINYDNLDKSTIINAKKIQTNNVSISENSWNPDVVDSYVPASIEINSGTIVTWANNDTVIHTVTDTKKIFDSKFIQAGGSWQYTFEKPGEYEYLCTLHPWMKGTVSVIDASSHSMK
jgi:plastocyanin